VTDLALCVSDISGVDGGLEAKSLSKNRTAAKVYYLLTAKGTVHKTFDIQHLYPLLVSII
jgi:hypothetical protein